MKKIVKIMIIFIALIVINTNAIYADAIMDDDMLIDMWSNTTIENGQDDNEAWNYSLNETENVTSPNTSSNENILYIAITGIIVIAICIIAFTVLKKGVENQKERKNKDDKEN